jgi:hypothetical protein
MIANLAPCGLRLTLLIRVRTWLAIFVHRVSSERVPRVRSRASPGQGPHTGSPFRARPRRLPAAMARDRSFAPTRRTARTPHVAQPSTTTAGGRRDVRERAHEPLMNQRLAPAHPLSRARRAGPRRTQPRERRRASPHPRCLPARDPSNEGCACPQVVQTCGQSACAFSISAPSPNTDGIRRVRGLGLAEIGNCHSRRSYAR